MKTEECKIEDIIKRYDLVIVDSCMFGSESRLPKVLYTIRSPMSLARHEAEILAEISFLERRIGQFVGKSNVYLTPEVKDELVDMRDHFARCANFIEARLWNELIHSMQQSRIFLKQDSYDKRKNQHHNLMREKARHYFLEQGKRDVVAKMYQRPVELVKQLAETVDFIINNMLEYCCTDKNYKKPNVGVSDADAGLVHSLFEYLMKESTKTAAIISSDGHILSVYKFYLSRLAKSGPENDYITRSLVAFYIKERDVIIPISMLPEDIERRRTHYFLHHPANKTPDAGKIGVKN